MKAIGIIAEYNPFHKGHLYHIEKIKEKYPDYALVLVMSGNFTERGECAIIDKWKRCEIALQHGVDLVLELPYPFSTQSADFFAEGAITLLEKMKVEKVIFGSESNALDDLEVIARTQLDNEEFDPLVKIYSKMGKNYPTAISLAVLDLTGKSVNTPNDLLGVSYLKAIYKNQYSIQAETIQRINNYHKKELDGEFSSATAIREALKKGEDVSCYVPKDTLPYLENLHFMDEYFPILKYKIMTTDDLSIYQTVEEGIDKVLKREISSSTSYQEFIQKIKSKRYTYNKISRMLLHILCGFTKDLANQFTKISYIRILGFNEIGREYLNQQKKEVDVPIISKITKYKDPMLEFEMKTTKIYDILKNDCIGIEEKRILYQRKDNIS